MGIDMAISDQARDELASASIRQEVEFLNSYTHDDWLGFSVITGGIASARRGNEPEPLFRELVLAVVRELLDLGVSAGDLTASDEHPFIPWSGSVDEVMARIEQGIADLGRLPKSSEVCWFFRTGD
jgi:hypothetical protein